jgi:hypothetical protein
MANETRIPLLLPELPAAEDLLRRQREWFRTGWTVSKILMAGLLMVYLVGWANDLQRLISLEAEPSPPSKVITKFQAWERIYPSRTAR